MSKIGGWKIASFLFVLDIFFKYLAIYGNYAVINYRISAGLSLDTLVFWLFSCVVCLWLYRERQWLLFFGGAGNMLSRLIWGGVIDYWSFFGLFYNNLSDYMLFFGATLYGYTYFVRRQRDRRDRQATRSDL